MFLLIGCLFFIDLKGSSICRGGSQLAICTKTIWKWQFVCLDYVHVHLFPFVHESFILDWLLCAQLRNSPRSDCPCFYYGFAMHIRLPLIIFVHFGHHICSWKFSSWIDCCAHYCAILTLAMALLASKWTGISEKKCCILASKLALWSPPFSIFLF